MLYALSIRDLVLVDRLDLCVGEGFTALTGETGAGKSILLDALGLACGGRADRGLIRKGASQAMATAAFRPPGDHPVHGVLRDHGIEANEDGVVLRRILQADGRSRSYLNDAPVTVGLLQEIGEMLVEVCAQHDAIRLATPGAQRDTLDAFAGALQLRAEVGRLWADLVAAREDANAARARAEGAARDAEWQAFVLAELDQAAPEAGEETALAAERAFLMGAEKTRQALHDSQSALTGDGGAEARLMGSARTLERALRLADAGAGAAADAVMARCRAAADAIDRALIECEEARSAIADALGGCGGDTRRLDVVDERLGILRSLARKHGVAADDLAGLHARIAAGARQAEDLVTAITVAETAASRAHAQWLAAAERLSAMRRAAADRLARAVMEELGPLRLERVRLLVVLEPLDEPGPNGVERVRFEIETNPGAGFGPLERVASGGELARIALAIRVALAAATPTRRTLVFDEIDQGVGGAVADAIGSRLWRLGQAGQTLAVTHAAQVAARADTHWRVGKAGGSDQSTLTRVDVLDADGRTEEVARMLAGAAITDEARAAAVRLMAAE